MHACINSNAHVEQLRRALVALLFSGKRRAQEAILEVGRPRRHVCH
jgi:hypothetical protein